jgi:hypothetical protein
MARSIKEIKSIMDEAYKEAFSLTDSQISNAGVWRLISGVVALAAYSVEAIFDMFKSDVDALVTNNTYGIIYWWSVKMQEFQYGYPLLEKDGKLYYSTVDESAKVIKYISPITVDGVLQLKIATEVAGELAIINDVDIRAAIDSYVEAIKPAGVMTQVVSNNADELRFFITMPFDGKLNKTTFESAVKTAIKQYLKSISFTDGRFRINAFRTALLNVPGMQDVFIEKIETKMPSSEEWVSISLNDNYLSVSGYFKHIENESVLTFEGV